MDCGPMQHTLLFILLAWFVGQGDGRWKKSNREMLQHDIKLFKEMTEKIKEELGEYYDELTDEPFTDYFFEEIDYMQSKIESRMKKKIRSEESNKNNYPHIEHLSNDIHNPRQYTRIFTKDTPQDYVPLKNVTFKSNVVGKDSEWPSFDDILTAMGKKYDWKNDRWIKVKNKVKEKNRIELESFKNKVAHQKHNFRYRIVKLNRAKSKRNIVIAVTAVR